MGICARVCVRACVCVVYTCVCACVRACMRAYVCGGGVFDQVQGLYMYMLSKTYGIFVS